MDEEIMNLIMFCLLKNIYEISKLLKKQKDFLSIC